jgi:UDP-GlcNAc:undecaprenyl-phosphate/decaprenyl-phosphate GlcNAc-1-phosphate transferase
MLPLLIPTTGAFAVSMVAIACARRYAIRQKLFDAPGDLKIHNHLIPRVGGAGMMAGLLAGFFLSMRHLPAKEWVGIGVVIAIGLTGLADDLWNLGPGERLGIHLLGGMILWTSGWRLGLFETAPLDLVATCVIFAFVINAVNMLDGIDGLAAGVSAIGAAGFLAVLPFSPGFTIAAITMTVCAAMLLFNFPPASIFMGDSGSTLVGALLVLLSLEWIRTNPVHNSHLLPFLFLALPVADGAFAIVRRVRGRKSPFQGDRRHFYDLLHRRGLSNRAVLFAAYAASALLVFAGWYIVARSANEPLVIGGAGLGVCCAAYFLGMLSPGDSTDLPPVGAPGNAFRIEP